MYGSIIAVNPRFGYFCQHQQTDSLSLSLTHTHTHTHIEIRRNVDYDSNIGEGKRRLHQIGRGQTTSESVMTYL